MIDICYTLCKGGWWSDGAVVFALNSGAGREWETGLLRYAGTRFLDRPVDGREVMDFAHDLDSISDDENDDLGYYLFACLLCLVGSAMESSMSAEDRESWQRTSMTGQLVSHTHKLRLSVDYPSPGDRLRGTYRGRSCLGGGVEVSWID